MILIITYVYCSKNNEDSSQVLQLSGGPVFKVLLHHQKSVKFMSLSCYKGGQLKHYPPLRCAVKNEWHNEDKNRHEIDLNYCSYYHYYLHFPRVNPAKPYSWIALEGMSRISQLHLSLPLWQYVLSFSIASFPHTCTPQLPHKFQESKQGLGSTSSSKGCWVARRYWVTSLL